MSEQLERIRAKVSELEQELQSIKSIDPRLREDLEKTIAEIHTDLSGNGTEGTLASRFGEMKQEFQDSHPTLVRMVGSIVDALGEIGI